MRMNLDPTMAKVVIIALLITLEGIALHLYVIVQSQRMPTDLEIIGIVLLAVIQLITYLLTFLQTGQVPQIEIKEKPVENPT